MMIRKYKIGNFTIEIKSQVNFQDVEPYSLFLYDGEQIDYCVNVEFASELPQEIEKPCYVSQDKVYGYEKDVLCCYYKSRDTDSKYYACRIADGKNITIIIDDKYRDMLWARVIFSLIGIEDLVAESNGCVIHSSFIEKNGGAILFVSYYDILARAKVFGAENAYARLSEIMAWFADVEAAFVASGETDAKKFFEPYYNALGLTLQGRNEEGSLGLHAEFIENAILYALVPNAFFGMDTYYLVCIRKKSGGNSDSVKCCQYF